MNVVSNIGCVDKLWERLNKKLKITYFKGVFCFSIDGLGYIPNNIKKYVKENFVKIDKYRLLIVINRIVTNLSKEPMFLGYSVYKNIIMNISKGPHMKWCMYSLFDYEDLQLPVLKFPLKFMLSLANTPYTDISCFEVNLFQNGNIHRDDKFDSDLGYIDSRKSYVG